MRLIVSLLGILYLVTGCQRSCGQVWQDTKTCSRQLKRGVLALAGVHEDSRQVASREQFHSYLEEEFIPLQDENIYSQIVMGDAAYLRKIDADTPIPASRETPGEKGSALPGIEGFINVSDGPLAATFRPVHFDLDGHVIQGRDDLETVQRIASYLKSHPNTYVFIEGHCDERGAAAYNYSLGVRRGNAVRNALVKEGVHPDRLLTVSYGKDKPIAQGHDEKSWQLNRRSQFRTFDKG